MTEPVSGCQRLNSGTNLRECEDQSRFKVQAVPVFRFDRCKMSSRALYITSRAPGGMRTHVEDHRYIQLTKCVKLLIISSALGPRYSAQDPKTQKNPKHDALQTHKRKNKIQINSEKSKSVPYVCPARRAQNAKCCSQSC
jgi:hypothetical protein